MQIPKPTQADRARFESLVPDDARVEVKPMFGNLAAFIDGNMFMGLFGSDVGVKLPTSEEEALRRAGGGPFGPAARPMSGYVSLPATFDAARAEPWITKSLAFVASLPPKAKRTSKKR